MPTKPVLKKFYDDIARNHDKIIDFGRYKVTLELYYDLPESNHTLLLSLVDGTRTGTITEFKSAYPIANKDLYYMIQYGDVSLLQTSGDIRQAVNNLTNLMVANLSSGKYSDNAVSDTDAPLLSYAYQLSGHPKLLTLHYDQYSDVIFTLRGETIMEQRADLPEWRSIIRFNGRSSDSRKMLPGFSGEDIETIQLCNKFLKTIQTKGTDALSKLPKIQSFNSSHLYQLNNAVLSILQCCRYDQGSANYNLAYNLARRSSGKSEHEFGESFHKFKLNRLSSDIYASLPYR